MNTKPSYVRDLLLIGGGHAHVQVMRRFGMQPEPGLRLTLVSRESLSPYTGMLPGLVAGDYGINDLSIDLLRLSNFAQCRLIVDSVTHVDSVNQQVSLESARPPLRYDLLSINTGGDNTLQIPGSEYIYHVKPIGRFLAQWQELEQEISKQDEVHIAVIGGGPGGVELAIALRQSALGIDSVDILTRNRELLPEHSNGVRRRALQAVIQNQIHVIPDFDVTSVERSSNGGLTLFSRQRSQHRATHILSATGIVAPSWIKQSGLAVDQVGCLKVNRHLQSVSIANVFGAGDSVALSSPRPKSGVYSVRAGPILTHNLRQFLIDQKLRSFRPQKQALALLRTSSTTAIASRGRFQSHSKGLGKYKDWIDRRFMRKFNDLPEMRLQEPEYRGKLKTAAPVQSMRCGGCGAKLGADILERTLHRLDIHQPQEVLKGIGEDAAVISINSSNIALTCDGFRQMIDDPWLFGRIVAHHALNDLYAMGSQPSIALALATVPLMSDTLMEEDLFQLMSGSLSVFKSVGVSLVGGHSAEGAELSLAFTILGEAPYKVMEKGQLQAGDALVLTKPLGVGAILAGGMDGRSSAMSVERAVGLMDQSNFEAMKILKDFDVVACTDVTGFGFIGHLAEMLRASEITATININKVPMLKDGIDAISQGIESSLQPNNEQALRDCNNQYSSEDSGVRLLADPQTSGGLLFGVNPNRSEECLEALKTAGYAYASIVGSVNDGAFKSKYIDIV